VFLRSLSETQITKEETAMKKFFGALIAASFIFAAVFASASVLPLLAGTGSIQSSNLATVTCQNTPVSVTYGTQLNGQGENEIASVTLHNIEAGCVGDQAEISLFQTDPPYSGLGGPGNMVWYGWDTITASGNITLSMTAHNPAAPLAADVKHYSVMFSAQ
jgi:hypothetical protein